MGRTVLYLPVDRGDEIRIHPFLAVKDLDAVKNDMDRNQWLRTIAPENPMELFL
jgi:hypothetical protein